MAAVRAHRTRRKKKFFFCSYGCIERTIQSVYIGGSVGTDHNLFFLQNFFGFENFNVREPTNRTYIPSA